MDFTVNRIHFILSEKIHRPQNSEKGLYKSQYFHILEAGSQQHAIHVKVIMTLSTFRVKFNSMIKK